MSYLEPKFEDCCFRLPGYFLLAVVIVVVTSGCLQVPVLPDGVAARRVHVTTVSTGIGASYELADKWMVRDVEFGAVTMTGGGTDSCIWVEKAVPPDVTDEYVAWVIACAKKVDGIYSVVVEVDGEERAIWRKPVPKPSKLVDILVEVTGDNPSGFVSQWSPKVYQAIEVSHVGNDVWGFRLPDSYLQAFVQHVTFVGSYGRIAVAHGIMRIDVFQSGKRIGGWIGEY